MELRSGYKQTDVGVIPEDWDIAPLGRLALISAGGTPDRTNSRYWNGDVPWVTTTEIDFNVIRETAQFITKDGLDNSAAKMLHEGTLLMALYGQGKTRGKVGILGIKAATNQACAAIVLQDEVEHGYLFHYLVSRYKAIRELSNTGNQENLNNSLVRSIPVLLPPPQEQRAIATALSDVDALLAGLDRLIAKKRDLKQAAMQQLLTGDTRLEGFDAEWTLRRLGDHVTFLSHGTNSRAELRPDGPVKYLHYGDIHASTLAMLEPASLPSLPEEKAKGLDRLRDGDLVFADASEDLTGVSKSVEICGVGSTELVAGLHTITARFDKDVLADGFKAYLQFCPVFASQLRRLAAGTKVYATNRSHIAGVEMRLPGTDEQSAIAAVFRDMDAEIEALEQRRAKTADLKQAMMQELLTGRTRLVSPEVAHA